MHYLCQEMEFNADKVAVSTAVAAIVLRCENLIMDLILGINPQQAYLASQKRMYVSNLSITTLWNTADVCPSNKNRSTNFKTQER